MLLAAIDLETTGFRNHHVATQVAVALINTENLKIEEHLHLHLRLNEQQMQEADPEALACNGWTRESNETAMDREEALAKFDQWMLFTGPKGLVAHNAPFDRRMAVAGRLVRPEIPWFCTQKGLKVYRNRYRVDLGSNQLQTLARLCGYQQSAAHISALDDCYACANGFLYLLSVARLGVEEMAL